MIEKKEYALEKWGSIFLGLLAATPFAAAGIFLLLFASAWEWLVIGARNGSVYGSCDFGGSTAYLAGIGLIGVGLLWTAGLIARSVGWVRPTSSSTWANVIILFLIAIGLTIFGYFFGDGCAVIH